MDLNNNIQVYSFICTSLRKYHLYIPAWSYFGKLSGLVPETNMKNFVASHLPPLWHNVHFFKMEESNGCWQGVSGNIINILGILFHSTFAPPLAVGLSTACPYNNTWQQFCDTFPDLRARAPRVTLGIFWILLFGIIIVFCCILWVSTCRVSFARLIVIVWNTKKNTVTDKVQILIKTSLLKLSFSKLGAQNNWNNKLQHHASMRSYLPFLLLFLYSSGHHLGYLGCLPHHVALLYQEN